MECCENNLPKSRPSALWQKIRPQMGELINACSNLESSFEKAKKEAYERGLNEAWDTARKIVMYFHDGGYCNAYLRKIFGTAEGAHILRDYTPMDAIEKIKSFEENENPPMQFDIGDEVEFHDGSTGTVCDVDENKVYGFYFDEDKMINFCMNTDQVKKTGKNYKGLALTIQEMKKK